MSKQIMSRWPFLIGTLFVVAALSLYLFNTYENQKAKEQVENVLLLIHEDIPNLEMKQENSTVIEKPLAIPNGVEINQFIPDYILNPAMEMPTVEVEGNNYIGTLYFPSLQAELPVMSNWSYSNLKVSPCLYTGSIYTGNAVIAAHNYTCHFGHLFNLSPSDVVHFTDADGNAFSYVVVVIEVLEPTAIEYMTDGRYELSLFTCTLGGASRFTVRCQLL